MSPLNAIFSAAGAFYLFLLPLMILQLTTLLMLPALLRGNGKAADVGESTYSYLAQSIGLLLMSAGGLPSAYALLASQPLYPGMYTGMLLIFAIGGIVYLYHDAHVRHLESSSKATVSAIFFFSWKFLGLVAMLAGGLSAVLRMMLSGGMVDPRWWVLHLVLFIYGVLVMWFTSHPVRTGGAFATTQIAHAAKVQKAAVQKKRKR